MLQEDAPATLRQRAAIVSALRSEGVEVEERCAAGDRIPTPYSVEHRFTCSGYRLSFRVLEPHWVLIGMYERMIDRPALRDPFTTMARFIDLLRRRRLGIAYVVGRIETKDFRLESDLDDDRLLRYYLRWGGASIVPVEQVPGLSPAKRLAASWQGIRYVRVGVTDFRMPKDRHRAKRTRGSESRNGSATT